MQAVRHDLRKGLPMRKFNLSGYLCFCAFLKGITCACNYVSTYWCWINFVRVRVRVRSYPTGTFWEEKRQQSARLRPIYGDIAHVTIFFYKSNQTSVRCFPLKTWLFVDPVIGCIYRYAIANQTDSDRAVSVYYTCLQVSSPLWDINHFLNHDYYTNMACT